MVSYFYEAGYDASKYHTSDSLLHAQVATIADKYDCKYLYELASSLLKDSLEGVESKEWIAIAAHVYNSQQ